MQEAKNPQNTQSTGGSIAGQSEQRVGVGSAGAAPVVPNNVPKASIAPFVVRGCYTNGWISGRHRWSSKIFFMCTNQFVSQFTDSLWYKNWTVCNIPLRE